VANKAQDLNEGIALARRSLESGAALNALQSLVNITTASS
jgi:anthranilate phosphoribosyltransferase